MFHKKPQVYVRPQRGRTSATSRGGVLFDPYRVGDASFPFFLERGIPSEFVLIVSHYHCSSILRNPVGAFCFLFIFLSLHNKYSFVKNPKDSHATKHQT